MQDPPERKRVEEVFDIKCLRMTLGVNIMGRVRNRDIRRIYGKRMNMLERVDLSVLKLFGHMKWMNDG